MSNSSNARRRARGHCLGLTFGFALAALTISVSCGDDGGSPSRPSTTVTSITVTGASMVHIGASETYTASAVLSSGTSQVPSCVWGLDATPIATIDQSGRVTGTASGEVTIWCDAQGVRGTKRLRVLPNYQGTWIGSYAIETCDQTGDFARVNFCRDFTRDRVLPTSANLTQQNDTVTGVFNLGQIQGQQSSGPIALDGTLRLSVIHVGTSTFTITSNWAVNSTRAGQITGSVLQIWREAFSSGEARVNSRVFNTNRQLGGASITRTLPTVPNELSEVLQLMAR